MNHYYLLRQYYCTNVPRVWPCVCVNEGCQYGDKVGWCADKVRREGVSQLQDRAEVLQTCA